MPKSDRRERKRFRARYAPTKTNPGLPMVMRALAARNRRNSRPAGPFRIPAEDRDRWADGTPGIEWDD